MTFDFRFLPPGQRPSVNTSGTSPSPLLALSELSERISDPHAKTELRTLLNEHDPELLGAGLRSIASRQESRGHTEIAVAIYETLTSSPGLCSDNEARLAQARLEALRGRGSFGDRFEIFSRNFLRDVSDPAMLAGMAFAGVAFQGVRLASYARLLSNPSANLITRGIGARGLSLALGLAVEAPAFSLGTRTVNGLLGRGLNSGNLGQELAATYLTLGALRVSGGLGDVLFRRLSPASGGILSRGLVRQASMFTGITAAHWLEQQVGLRERSDGASLLAASLATLVHFNVSGRLLHGITGGGFTQRLRVQQERMENMPPSLLGTAGPRIGWTLPSPTPAWAGAEGVFMSNNSNGTPSERPPAPVGGSETRGSGRSSRPPPLLDVRVEAKADLTLVEATLSRLYDSRTPSLPWMAESLDSIVLYAKVLEMVRTSEENSPSKREEIVNHLSDLSAESDLIGRLLSEGREKAENHPTLAANQYPVGQFIEHFYRSANNFINVLDHTGTIPEPLQHLRMARFWLQHGIEKATLGETAPTEHRANFPYKRSGSGTYDMALAEKHVIIVGDERGPRTFALVNLGHRVTHVEFDTSRLRTTQKLTDMRVARSKDSGEWRLNLANAGEAPQTEFHARIQDAQPADLVEAYFPAIFDTLRPRADTRRVEQLREFIVTNLMVKLKPEGSVFVISNRDDAIEDLARVVSQNPLTEVLELQQRRDTMPLRAGMHVTAEPGDGLYSWLIFRRKI